MPWKNYLAYSMLITINTMYITLTMQSAHPIIFATIILAITLMGAAFIGLGEWHRVRHNQGSSGSDK